jgi:ssDNA-binding Zn-finger/Zn-ribbon topoisomerase 1
MKRGHATDSRAVHERPCPDCGGDLVAYGDWFICADCGETLLPCPADGCDGWMEDAGVADTPQGPHRNYRCSNHPDCDNVYDAPARSWRSAAGRREVNHV